MWSTILLSPTCPIARTLWLSWMICCCRTLGTTINHRSPSTRYKIPCGDTLNFFLYNYSSLWLITSCSSPSILCISSKRFISFVDNWAPDAWTITTHARSLLAPLWVGWWISWFSVWRALLLLNASVTILALPSWYLNLGLIDYNNLSRIHLAVSKTRLAIPLGGSGADDLLPSWPLQDSPLNNVAIGFSKYVTTTSSLS